MISVYTFHLMRTRRARFFPAKSMIGKAYNYKREGNTITGFAINEIDGTDEAQALYNFGYGREGQMSSSTPIGWKKTAERSIRFFHEKDANEVEKQLKAAKYKEQ